MSVTLLTLISCLAVLALLALVAIDLRRIIVQLEPIGGDGNEYTVTSYLAKIRFGLRAIDSETAQLAPQVTALNQGLRALDGGLRSVAAELAIVAKALGEGSPS